MSKCNLGLYVPVHLNVRNHPKLKRLCIRLFEKPSPGNQARTLGMLVNLWCWVLEYYPSGDLTGSLDAEIEDAGLWDGEEGLFIKSLEETGFMFKNDEGVFEINSWGDYGGKMISGRNRNASKVKNWRDKKKQEQLRDGSVTVTEPKCNQGEQNRTEQNRTEEEQKRDNPPYAPPEAGGCCDEPDENPSITISICPPKEKRKPRKRQLTAEQQKLHDQFYAAYPRKKDPGQSEKAWISVNPDQETFAKILSAVGAYKAEIQRIGTPPDRIKHPATWLRARSWESDYNENTSNPAEADWANKKPEDVQDVLPF